MDNIDINKNSVIEFSELKVVSISTDYNQIFLKLITLYKQIEKINNKTGDKDELTFEDVVTAIQNGNKNFNM